MPRQVTPRVTSISRHAYSIAEALYRYGALTREQLAQALGLSEYTVAQHLKRLVDEEWVALARDHAIWRERRKREPQTGVNRPKTAFYLSYPRGVAAGGNALGVEYLRAASNAYKKVDIPSKTAHRVSANDYLLYLRDAAREASLDFPEEGIGCESSPLLPLFSGASPPKRKGQAPKYRPLYPDGHFRLGVAHGEHPFYMEYETGLHSQAVVDHFRLYYSRYRRRLSPRDYEGRWHEGEAYVEPIVLVTERATHADTLRRRLAERIPLMEVWEEVEAAFAEATARTGEPHERPEVHPLHMVLVTDMQRVLADPLGQVYEPLVEYPEEYGGSPVDLLDAAHLAAVLAPVAEAPELTLDAMARGGR